MRLTCPNCGAQYEIPEDVIPHDGRDVQCSNCGDTWFQQHPDHRVEDDEASVQYTADVSYDDSGDDAELAEDIDEDADTDPDPVHAQRRRLDPDVTSVLREEAERETQARARESSSLESQPDLGLDSSEDGADRRSREAQARMARLRGRPDIDEAEDTSEIDPTSRRGLLPDIEEINSSLRNDTGSSDQTNPEDMYPEADSGVRGGGGFRRGFVLVVLLAAILTLLYVFAPQIGGAVPALADVLGEYVETVNRARVWLNDLIASLMRWLDSMASSAPSGDAN
ncbi:hypothetical protein G5B38_15370 [Pseudohalocynthiibacter aestuariivivens]|uniref:Zinc-ribbon domain-containing protein n=1 Tax=Roseovarius pelagicus TaxID=2980108 RepID=A0ABY6DEW6_9RHOB|nr:MULTISPECIES: zinc-ribbon domain-containing protein [Rhodobacterales]QIE46792.1 hypothetical protein G5B38_15370 [Pseudohalocynthiibacter aestuariivivens]UXX84668.1 zinc-ribbon domain-containing protein [Roseovarius pelagicus]